MVIKTGHLFSTFAELDAGTQKGTDVVYYSRTEDAAIIIDKKTGYDYTKVIFANLGFGKSKSGGVFTKDAYVPQRVHTIAVDKYMYYTVAVSDVAAKIVLILDNEGEIQEKIGWWPDPVLGDGTLMTFTDGPQGLCWDINDYLIICDYDDEVGAGGGQIIIFDDELRPVTYWATARTPSRVVADGTTIFVVSKGEGYVSSYAYTGGAALHEIHTPNAIDFSNPGGIALSGNYVYVTDYDNNRVVKLNKSDLSYAATIGVSSPLDVTIDTAGNIYVLAESTIVSGAYVIYVYDAAHALQTTLFSDAAFTRPIQSISVNALKDLFLYELKRNYLWSLVLGYGDAGLWRATVDAGEKTEYKTVYWKYELGASGQTVRARVRVSTNGVDYGDWSAFFDTGTPIPMGHRDGRYLQIDLMLSQPGGNAIPPRWTETPRVVSVTALWEEAVWTMLEGEWTFYFKNPKTSKVTPILIIPFARAWNTTDEPQMVTYAPGFSFYRDVERARCTKNTIVIDCEIYNRQALDVLCDQSTSYYIKFRHENENTGEVTEYYFSDCKYRGRNISTDESPTPIKVSLNYVPRYIL